MEDYGILTMWPNKSPEPTPIIAVSSAVAVHVADTAVAQLFSLGHIKHYEKDHTYDFVDDCVFRSRSHDILHLNDEVSAKPIPDTRGGSSRGACVLGRCVIFYRLADYCIDTRNLRSVAGHTPQQECGQT